MDSKLFKAVRFHAALAAVLVICTFLYLLTYSVNIPLVAVLFLAGALGGVTNTYMRVRGVPSSISKIGNKTANTLAILQVYISPFIAGVFGVVLYAFFLTDMLNGSLFPNFAGLEEEYKGTLTLFQSIYPKEQVDAAKAIIWSFIAGFSERLVPNIIDKMAQEAGSVQSEDNK